MKIGIVALSDFDRSSSTVRRVQMISKGLSVLGHHLHIIVPERFQPGPKYEVLNGLHLHWGIFTSDSAARKINSRLAARWAAVRLVNHLCSAGLNWLVLYNLGLEAIPLLMFARRHGTLVAAEYCDARIPSESSSLEDRIRFMWLKAADLLIPRLTQLNIVISRYLEEQIGSRNPDAPVLIIPPLVDTHLFKPHPESAKRFREQWRLNETTVISYLGSYWNVEGVAILLRAAKELVVSGEPFTLVLSGAAVPGRDCDDVQRMIAELGLFEKVICTGWLQTNQVIAAMSAADILVIPKIRHLANRAGVPTKLAEYLAMERAVVATRQGDIPLYLRDDYDSILCEASNHLSLAEALKKLVSNPNLRTRLAGNARKTAIEFFDYRTAGRKIEEKLRAYS